MRIEERLFAHMIGGEQHAVVALAHSAKANMPRSFFTMSMPHSS